MLLHSPFVYSRDMAQAFVAGFMTSIVFFFSSSDILFMSYYLIYSNLCTPADDNGGKVIARMH